MAGQYQNLVNKQYNSPIQLYSDRSVREILEKETRVLANGAVGIDFNNPLTNKPANLQNSAVLRMLEEEEERKRSGQPGSLKRVAWPPPNSEIEEYIEQAPVQSQGGPLYSSNAPGLQNNQAPKQQTPPSPITTPIYQQSQSLPKPLPQSPVITANNTFQPINLTSSVSSQSAAQFAPLSPSAGSKSPVSFTSVAKPWSPQADRPLSAPQFKSVQPPQIYQSSKLYQYHSQEQTRETQTVVLPQYQPAYQPPVQQETTFQQYQPPSVLQNQSTVQVTTRDDHTHAPQTKVSDSIRIETQEVNLSQPATKSVHIIPVAVESGAIQPATPKSESDNLVQESFKVSKPIQNTPQSIVEPSTPKPQIIPTEQLANPKPSQPSAAAQGIAPQTRYQIPPKQVEPPPSTIHLRPQAPVSQAPPPLVTSQPATATLRGGKNLRGDLKWPPENVRERMAAEQQHLIDLSKGPAFKPRKQAKDYSSFFAKHALNSTYPGYKIPPGTQFYEHNPVM